MRDSFIDYSMSVIVQRALPDVRDGLKPVHRRILYAMNELGLQPNRAHKKSASVVGEVLGKYHPHGDMAVYDALVRMVQEFSLRYPLVDGQGNFGSIDGDSAAAYRYTEARLGAIAVELLGDIEKETVDFVPNFDDRLEEPTVLPSKFPNLLVNGSSGIAVGMATNIPPHNLREVVAAAKHVIDHPKSTARGLMKLVKGPDFPTGAQVHGQQGIEEAYETGRGRIVMRARAQIEETKRGERILITEIPFMVNKTRLIEQIAELARERKVDGISDLRDESDREGMRIVVELKRDAVPQIVLNQLYKHTQMQSTFGAIMLALVDGVPRIMDLKEMVQHFVDHRHEIVVRRSKYDLKTAEDREHILLGLKKAVDNIDAVVEIIKKAKDPAQAAKRLRSRYKLSERQADAILNMRLARLTGLEIEKLKAELKEVKDLIKELKAILASKKRRMTIIKKELQELADKYGDDRRTEIAGEIEDFSMEDLIADEDMVVTVSHEGYIKRIPVDTYRRQRRGGRGIAGMSTKDEDWVEHVFTASTHDYILFFTARGRIHWLKVHRVPQTSRTARGRPIVNLIKVKSDDRVTAMVPVREFTDDQYLLFATRKGIVKKTVLAAYGNVRSGGIKAINVADEDELMNVRLTSGSDEVILATRNGKAIRFEEEEVRDMGRGARGVKGIALGRDDEVVGLVVVRDEEALLVVTERGMGKRTPIEDYRLQRRGGKGVINVRLSAKTGKVISIKAVGEADELMLVTRRGIVNRQRVEEIRETGRNAQGVRLVNLDDGDLVVDVARVVSEEEEEELAGAKSK
ncbi:MAG: DNA gyrase subunit A [Gemmatimonadetes bacterium]|uniref:DNA gyrase subunit A n=1 Tax=Candidatus Kutchimonas denitrificans TaxID=3056748 RepID=A0AAE4ZB75_9BACT|nr:DNA gyrase subunit A [Gemmatimonadota bacterium]NIR76483.1 DNA gyrase subunit A [Candidatus Kutchimonas denitrificans]NIS03301.1 DNA gyrase subunit A [Gemmatimonadota bacterium]NIT69162.1 DNA gyrase subunit A [Gemmatimonadota bacterium]NIU54554.1 DNA gyrase subunit A [Gemmatimonadota bacterium]